MAFACTLPPALVGAVAIASSFGLAGRATGPQRGHQWRNPTRSSSDTAAAGEPLLSEQDVAAVPVRQGPRSRS
jgi:hypothetical protein